MSQTIAATDAESQTAFPFAETEGWYTVCPDVGGRGDPWCFKEKCDNHEQPQCWHWKRTDWKTVMEWLKEQHLGTQWNEIDWKLEYDSPGFDSKLSISAQASGLGQIYVHCSQTPKTLEPGMTPHGRGNYVKVADTERPESEESDGLE